MRLCVVFTCTILVCNPLHAGASVAVYGEYQDPTLTATALTEYRSEAHLSESWFSLVRFTDDDGTQYLRVVAPPFGLQAADHIAEAFLLVLSDKALAARLTKGDHETPEAELARATQAAAVLRAEVSDLEKILGRPPSLSEFYKEHDSAVKSRLLGETGVVQRWRIMKVDLERQYGSALASKLLPVVAAGIERDMYDADPLIYMSAMIEQDSEMLDEAVRGKVRDFWSDAVRTAARERRILDVGRDPTTMRLNEMIRSSSIDKIIGSDRAPLQAARYARVSMVRSLVDGDLCDLFGATREGSLHDWIATSSHGTLAGPGGGMDTVMRSGFLRMSHESQEDLVDQMAVWLLQKYYAVENGIFGSFLLPAAFEVVAQGRPLGIASILAEARAKLNGYGSVVSEHRYRDVTEYRALRLVELALGATSSLAGRLLVSIALAWRSSFGYGAVSGWAFAALTFITYLMVTLKVITATTRVLHQVTAITAVIPDSRNRPFNEEVFVVKKNPRATTIEGRGVIRVRGGLVVLSQDLCKTKRKVKEYSDTTNLASLGVLTPKNAVMMQRCLQDERSGFGHHDLPNAENEVSESTRTPSLNANINKVNTRSKSPARKKMPAHNHKP